jgi:hypothetical protein
MGSETWKRWRFPAASVGLAVLLIMVAVLFGTVGAQGEGVSSELRKSVIQFLLVTALGALVGINVYEYRSRREAAERERQHDREAAERERQHDREAAERENQRALDSVTSVLNELDSKYRSVKKIRRLLRLEQARGPTREAYDEALLKLDEEQQDLEQLVREVEVLKEQSSNPARKAHLAATRGAIKGMEDYLGGLWSEAEDVAARSDDQFEHVDLTRMNAFLARVATGKSDFHEFNGNYRDARRNLIELLAESRDRSAAR